MSKISLEEQFLLKKPLLSLLLKDWDILDFTFEEAKCGIENRTVYITTAEQKYVLRIYRQERKSLEEIQDELEFMLFLHDQNLLIPRIFQTKHQTLLNQTKIDDTIWTSLLMEYRPGEHQPKYTVAIVRQMGRALAELHQISLTYPCKQSHVAPERITDDRWSTIDQEIAQRPDVCAFMEEAKLYQITVAHLPSGHLHGDFVQTNLLWEKDRLSTILDFDDMEYSWLVLDIAVSAWHILVQDLDWTLVEAFIDAYSHVRPLAKDEQTSLIPLIKFVNYVRGIDQALLNDFGQEWKHILRLNDSLKTDCGTLYAS